MFPKVSVIIPCRNEELHIAECILSIIRGTYPSEQTEILVVDGSSEDNTEKIVTQLKDTYTNITILQNPKRIFPAAVNVGVKYSTGEYLLILGAHALFSTDYIEKCINAAMKYDADNVGGILITTGLNKGVIGKSINKVLSSSFGVGNATFRTGSKDVTEVDTVFGGCYKKEVFEKIGYFNEHLISSSDMEFNKRLKRSGGKIFLIPDIIVNYYTRNTLNSFFKNNLRNGYWAIYPIGLTTFIPVSLRHFVPLLFLLSIVGCLLLSLIFPFFLWVLLAEMSLYLIASIGASFSSIPINILFATTMPLLFLSLHLLYGLGSFWALLKLPFVKKQIENES